MSVAGLLDAMRTNVNPAYRLVWMCLENHANGHRWWRMTEEAIAEELHLSADTIGRAIGWLIGKRIVRVERYKRRPTIFHMLRSYPKAEPLTPHTADSTAESVPPVNPAESGLKPELTPQDAEPTAELTPQDAESLYPPVRIHQESPPEVQAAVADAPARPPKVKRKTQLPDDWVPGPEGVAYAEEHGLTDVLAEQVARFRDYHLAKGSRMDSWAAAWRNWCRNAVRFRAEAQRRQQSGDEPRFRNGFAQAMFNDWKRGQGEDAPPAAEYKRLPTLAEMRAARGKEAA